MDGEVRITKAPIINKSSTQTNSGDKNSYTDTRFHQTRLKNETPGSSKESQMLGSEQTNPAVDLEDTNNETVEYSHYITKYHMSNESMSAAARSAMSPVLIESSVESEYLIESSLSSECDSSHDSECEIEPLKCKLPKSVKGKQGYLPSRSQVQTTVTSGKLFGCKYKGCTFTTKHGTSLRRHSKHIHGQIKPCVCHGCHKSFKQHDTLKQHMAQCHSSKAKGHMTKHVITPAKPSNMKPKKTKLKKTPCLCSQRDKEHFHCPRCSITLLSPWGWTVHVVEQHGMVPAAYQGAIHKCPNCQFVALHKSTFQHHIQSPNSCQRRQIKRKNKRTTFSLKGILKHAPRVVQKAPTNVKSLLISKPASQSRKQFLAEHSTIQNQLRKQCNYSGVVKGYLSLTAVSQLTKSQLHSQILLFKAERLKGSSSGTVHVSDQGLFVKVHREDSQRSLFVKVKNTFKCRRCPYQTLLLTSVKKHCIVVHLDNYKCDLCNVTQSVLWSFMRHIYTSGHHKMTEQVLYELDDMNVDCSDPQLRDRGPLLQVPVTHPDIPIVEDLSDFCGCNSDEPMKLIWGQSQHTAWMCMVCFKQYKCKKNLVHHIEVVHPLAMKAQRPRDFILTKAVKKMPGLKVNWSCLPCGLHFYSRTSALHHVADKQHREQITKYHPTRFLKVVMSKLKPSDVVMKSKTMCLTHPNECKSEDVPKQQHSITKRNIPKSESVVPVKTMDRYSKYDNLSDVYPDDLQLQSLVIPVLKAGSIVWLCGCCHGARPMSRLKAKYHRSNVPHVQNLSLVAKTEHIFASMPKHINRYGTNGRMEWECTLCKVAFTNMEDARSHATSSTHCMRVSSQMNRPSRLSERQAQQEVTVVGSSSEEDTACAPKGDQSIVVESEDDSVRPSQRVRGKTRRRRKVKKAMRLYTPPGKSSSTSCDQSFLVIPSNEQGVYECKLCDIMTRQRESFDKHLATEWHDNHVREYCDRNVYSNCTSLTEPGASPTNAAPSYIVVPIAPSEAFKCLACQFGTFDRQTFQEHLKNDAHVTKIQQLANENSDHIDQPQNIGTEPEVPTSTSNKSETPPKVVNIRDESTTNMITINISASAISDCQIRTATPTQVQSITKLYQADNATTSQAADPQANIPPADKAADSVPDPSPILIPSSPHSPSPDPTPSPKSDQKPALVSKKRPSEPLTLTPLSEDATSRPKRKCAETAQNRIKDLSYLDTLSTSTLLKMARIRCGEETEGAPTNIQPTRTSGLQVKREKYLWQDVSEAIDVDEDEDESALPAAVNAGSLFPMVTPATTTSGQTPPSALPSGTIDSSDSETIFDLGLIWKKYPKAAKPSTTSMPLTNTRSVSQYSIDIHSSLPMIPISTSSGPGIQSTTYLSTTPPAHQAQSHSSPRVEAPADIASLLQFKLQPPLPQSLPPGQGCKPAWPVFPTRASAPPYLASPYPTSLVRSTALAHQTRDFPPFRPKLTCHPPATTTLQAANPVRPFSPLIVNTRSLQPTSQPLVSKSQSHAMSAVNHISVVIPNNAQEITHMHRHVPNILRKNTQQPSKGMLDWIKLSGTAKDVDMGDQSVKTTTAVIDGQASAVMARRSSAVMARQSSAVMARRSSTVGEDQTTAVLAEQSLAVIDGQSSTVTDDHSTAVISRQSLAVSKEQSVTVLDGQTAVMDGQSSAINKGRCASGSEVFVQTVATTTVNDVCIKVDRSSTPTVTASIGKLIQVDDAVEVGKYYEDSVLTLSSSDECIDLTIQSDSEDCSML